MAWIAATSGLALSFVVIRWWRLVHGVVGPKPSAPWFSCVLLAVVTGVTGTIALRHYQLERRLSKVASSLAGRSVRVECQNYASSFFDGEIQPGYVHFEASGEPDASTTLNADICKSLASYIKSSKAILSQDEVLAVHVVTHEAMHMAGRLDEAGAECAAVQRDAMTARLLGASAADAAALATTYWTTLYPRLPGEYRTADCGPGSPLDEALGDGPWGP